MNNTKKKKVRFYNYLLIKRKSKNEKTINKEGLYNLG